MPADRQDDIPSGGGQFVGELGAGRGGPDDENSTVGDVSRIAIQVGGDLPNRRMEGLRRLGYGGLIAVAGGDDNRSGGPDPGITDDLVVGRLAGAPS